MTTERPIQDFYIRILTQNKIEYIHIPNRTFGKNYRTPLCLKHLPDIIFLYKGTLYMREVGVEGRHLDRKSLQLKKMELWKSQGADISIVTNIDAAMGDLKVIGLLK